MNATEPAPVNPTTLPARRRRQAPPLPFGAPAAGLHHGIIAKDRDPSVPPPPPTPILQQLNVTWDGGSPRIPKAEEICEDGFAAAWNPADQPPTNERTVLVRLADRAPRDDIEAGYYSHHSQRWYARRRNVFTQTPHVIEWAETQPNGHEAESE